MRSVTSLVLAGALLAAVPGVARAQLHMGGQASLAFDRGNDNSPGVGIRAVLGLPALPIEVHGSVDYFFASCDPIDCSFWEANANAVFRFPTEGMPLKPYVGAGLNYQRYSLDPGPDASGTGFNILGGIELGATPLIRPFLEARYEITSGDGLKNQLLLTAGIIL